MKNETNWTLVLILGLLAISGCGKMLNIDQIVLNDVFVLYCTLGTAAWLITYLLSLVLRGMYDEE